METKFKQPGEPEPSYTFTITNPTRGQKSALRKLQFPQQVQVWALTDIIVSDGTLVKNDVISRINEVIDSLPEDDAQGHIYWMTFKEFIQKL